MGDPPRADKPGKLLKSVRYRTFVLWPLESGNWGSLSLRAIAPRDDREELSLSETLFFTFLGGGATSIRRFVC